MEQNSLYLPIEQQFEEVLGIILQHKNRAARIVNEELLLTAWHVGKYVSFKLNSGSWGRKVYNMVMFYEEYSSDKFMATIERYLNLEFVQPTTAQIDCRVIDSMPSVFLYLKSDCNNSLMSSVIFF